MVYVVRHVDALIMITIGLALCYYAYRSPLKSLGGSGARSTSTVQVLAPLIVCVGVMRLLVFDAALTPPSTPPPYKPLLVWSRYTLGDEPAAVRMPIAAEYRAEDKTVGGAVVHKTLWEADMKDLNAYMTFNRVPLPENTVPVPEQERVGSATKMLDAASFTGIQSRRTMIGDVEGNEITGVNTQKHVRGTVKVACTQSAVYYLWVVTSEAGEGLEVGRKCLESFTIAK